MKPRDVTRIRMQTGMSQAEFALRVGVPLRTYQGWEQGARAPSGAARALLRIVERFPRILDSRIKNTRKK